MINEIMQIDDEDEARRILMKLGNGLTQVDAYIAEWKAAKAPKPAPAPVKQKSSQRYFRRGCGSC